LISKNGLSESPGVRMKQANGLYTSTNIPNPEDGGSPYISRTVKKRNKMGYYYNTSDEHGEDVHIDLIAAKRRTEVYKLKLIYFRNTLITEIEYCK
jgi:hypothetical protein